MLRFFLQTEYMRDKVPNPLLRFYKRYVVVNARFSVVKVSTFDQIFPA